jgi:hypothetical protein
VQGFVLSSRFCLGALLFVATASGACEDEATGGASGGSPGDAAETGGTGGSATGGSAAGGRASGGSGGAEDGGTSGSAPGGGAGDEGGGAGSSGESSCPATSGPSSAGVLAVPAVSEASGLAASRTNPGVLYAHNDSGHPAEVYAVTESGAYVAALAFAGALAHDWEDIAVGPGPEAGTKYLYVADTGDDPEEPWRQTTVVERAPEPELSASERGLALTVEFESFYLSYPDGPHNAETLLVDPASGDLHLVTKETGRARVYAARAPLSSEDENELELVAEVALPASGAETGLVTGGDRSEDGRWLVLRTEAEAFLWSVAGGDLAAAFGEAPCSVPVGRELQGEAIGFAVDGASYFTLGEGASPELFRVELAPE